MADSNDIFKYALFSLIGLHKKIYTCVNAVDGKSVDSSLCSHLNKPTFADKPCNEGDCPPTYSWKVQYLPCNVTCGNGKL